jgi:hypothetical protein
VFSNGLAHAWAARGDVEASSGMLSHWPQEAVQQAKNKKAETATIWR